MEMLQAYRKEYGFNGITLMPVNMYGPEDNFNPEFSHVIPALILKFQEALDQGKSEVTVWGTGEASREFLYVGDCAKAIAMAMEKYDDPNPVNLGTNNEITISALAQLIAEKIGYDGRIVFDSSKPDGQPRRCLDTTSAKDFFGFEAETSLSEGLEKTIRWFNAN